MRSEGKGLKENGEDVLKVVGEREREGKGSRRKR